MPDLAIEVKSPDDSLLKMREKAIYDLTNGARLVWLAFPEKRQLEVHSAEAAIQTLNAEDILEGGDVLPGFVIPVSDLFRGI